MFARDALKKSPQPINIPDCGSVFDFYVDYKTGSFVSWRDQISEKVRKVVSLYTVVPEVHTINFSKDETDLRYLRCSANIYF